MLIINFLGLYLGGLATNPGVKSDWYQHQILQAPWTPPGYVFAITWTLIGITWSVLGAWLWKNKKKDRIPEQWEPVGKVRGLYMYPLKGGRRIELDSAECNTLGLQQLRNSQMQDRCLVVYKEDTKKSITAITYPKLLLIETFPTKNHFILKSPGNETIELKIPSLNKNFQDTIFMMIDEPVSVIDCGDEAAKWISNCLLGKSRGLRLGYKNYKIKRNTKNHPFAKLFNAPNMCSTGIFADIGPILLVNMSSLNDLNKRIPNSETSEHHFRPNIVIEGETIKPYAEDNWDWVKIGDTVLRYQIVSSRCAFTTIDPEKAKYAKNFEPLKTLRTYRPGSEYQGASLYPNFGAYFSIFSRGTVSVGDVVYLGKS